ncbi:MAG: hypothetical protein L3V56_01515 [Candidatus Magnetoovum sp. WYHC-5]|nr:hypothetical protein [Candidatus Magnetoovum sp. WYHC-5]
MVKTLELYNALKDKIGEEGTRVIIEAFDEVAQKGHANLATKEDLLKLELTLRAEIEKSRIEIEKSKSDLLRWMFIFWASQIGLIIALIKLLP